MVCPSEFGVKKVKVIGKCPEELFACMLKGSYNLHI
jgi:hypothetical protein